MKNTNKLNQAIAQRILVLDGAMGTMLERYNFSEEDFRGERFKEFHISVFIRSKVAFSKLKNVREAGQKDLN